MIETPLKIEPLLPSDGGQLRLTPKFLEARLGENSKTILTVFADRLLILKKFSIHQTLGAQLNYISSRFQLEPPQEGNYEITTVRGNYIRFTPKTLENYGLTRNDIFLCVYSPEDPEHLMAIEFCNLRIFVTGGLLQGFSILGKPA